MIEAHRRCLVARAGSGHRARAGIVVSDGWLAEVPAGQNIIKAEIEFYQRFNGESFVPGEPQTGGPRGVRAYPLLTDLRSVVGTCGNGLVGACDAGPNFGDMSFRSKSTNVVDASQNVGWGDGTGQFGPVPGVDYDDTTFVDTLVQTTVYDSVEDQFHRIDITAIAQLWHSGALANNGVLLGGLNGGDVVDGVTIETTAELWYHGADASSTLPEYAAFRGDTELQGQHRFFPAVIVTIPEPATIGLLGLGGLLGLARRRR